MPGNQAMLRSVLLFAKLPNKTIDRLDRLMVEREYAAGAEIVKEGDSGIGFFLIKSGAAEVRHKENPAPVRTLGVGDYFGDMALLDGHPRSATVAAVGPTQCLALTRWDFLAEVRQNPDIAIELLETLSLHLREVEAHSSPAAAIR
ncbi:MAG: cyclic nucleotide-binding domain-containing protein [Dehalococcoidia bacterium]